MAKLAAPRQFGIARDLGAYHSGGSLILAVTNNLVNDYVNDK